MRQRARIAMITMVGVSALILLAGLVALTGANSPAEETDSGLAVNETAPAQAQFDEAATDPAEPTPSAAQPSNDVIAVQASVAKSARQAKAAQRSARKSATSAKADAESAATSAQSAAESAAAAAKSAAEVAALVSGESNTGLPTQPTVDPAPTEPVPAEPAPTEPVPADPAPAATGTVPTEPVPTEPVPTEPAATEAAPTTEPTPAGSSNEPSEASSSSSFLTTNAEPTSVGTTTTYQAIQAGAPKEYRFEVANEYLAEYLRQNPSVRWWRQDHAAKTITALGEPKIAGKQVSITPTGGDDTAMISKAAAEAGAGGAVVGNGKPFKVANLITKKGVTYKNMPMVPANMAVSQMVKVTTPDVSFINSPIDMLEREVTNGFLVYDNGDRFTLVNGGIANQINRAGNAGSAMLRINQGANDVYIVGNTFKNGFASDQGYSIRGIHYSGPDRGFVPSGGIIASNHFENLQSSEKGADADAFVAQGFDLNNQFSKRLLFAANVGVDAGKRLIKAQSGGIDAHSNSNWWKTPNGPEGRRVTRVHYDSHGVSNVRWTNNYARTDYTNPNSESFFMQMLTHLWDADYNNSNAVFKNNVYEHNEEAAGRAPYVFRLVDRAAKGGPAWPRNSQFADNHLRGSGTVGYVYWFKDGNDPTGKAFNHKNNNSLKATKGQYRMN